jgi:hypothetical protein
MLGLGTSIIKSNFYKSQEYTAAVFDGTDDFITVSDNDALSFTASTGFGISMWLNLSADNHGILVKEEEYKFQISVNGSTDFIVVDDSTNTKARRSTTAGTFPFNSWVHVICEYRSSDQGVLIFINGTFVDGGNTKDTNYVEMENTNADLIIGKAKNSVGGTTGSGTLRFTDGAMTNLNIYQGNLSTTERQLVLLADPDGDFSNIVDNTIVASYSLTSNLNDSSGNGHNGSSGSGQSPTFTTV